MSQQQSFQPLMNAVESSERWQLKEAQSRFSEVVESALAGMPQCVTKNGEDAVLVISYKALVDLVRPKQSLLDFFRSSPLVDAGLSFKRLRHHQSTSAS